MAYKEYEDESFFTIFDRVNTLIVFKSLKIKELVSRQIQNGGWKVTSSRDQIWLIRIRVFFWFLFELVVIIVVYVKNMLDG